MTMMIVSRYVITGIAYAFLVGVVPAGPLLDALKFFEIILTPQVIIILSLGHHHIILLTRGYHHYRESIIIIYHIIKTI